MSPTCLPHGIGMVPLVASRLGPLPVPGGAESPLSPIRGLQNAPMSSQKGWLSSQVPSGEEEEGIVAGLDLSGHSYSHQGGGQWSFRSCSVTLNEDKKCESLMWMC